MSQTYVRCIEIDTRNGFKDAEPAINQVLESTTDEMIDIKHHNANSGKTQIIIIFEKKENKRFKE